MRATGGAAVDPSDCMIQPSTSCCSINTAEWWYIWLDGWIDDDNTEHMEHTRKAGEGVSIYDGES